MECSVCKMHSSVGFCAECRVLLCEECGIACESCGKMVCPEHAHETSSGRQLCGPCREERNARRSRRRHGRPEGEDQDRRRSRAAASGTSFESLATGEAAPEEEEEEIREAALTVSARKEIPPWRLSMFSALGGLVGFLIVLLFPVLPRGNAAATYLVALIPLLPVILAIVWAVVGILWSRYMDDRAKCLIGIGISVVALVVGTVGVAKAASQVSAGDQDMLGDTRDANMTQEELAEWRNQRLDRFRR